MLRKLCAGFLVVLAISPFTAPFQTYGAGDGIATELSGLSILSPGHEPTSHKGDADFLIGPVETRQSQLRCLVPFAASAFGVEAGVPPVAPTAPGPLESTRQLVLYQISAVVLRV
jgi:hypothetical protein